MSPAGCNDYSAFVTEVYVVLGTFNLNGVSNNDTVHPVISLKLGTILQQALVQVMTHTLFNHVRNKLKNKPINY